MTISTNGSCPTTNIISSSLFYFCCSLSGARSPELTSSIGKLRAIAWAAWAGWIGGRRGLSGTNYSGSGAFYREGGTGAGVQRRIKLSVARWRLRVMYHHHLHCDQRGENSHKSRWKYTPRPTTLRSLIINIGNKLTFLFILFSVGWV